LFLLIYCNSLDAAYLLARRHRRVIAILTKALIELSAASRKA
jgi:hypothetical protein